MKPAHPFCPVRIRRVAAIAALGGTIVGLIAGETNGTGVPSTNLTSRSQGQSVTNQPKPLVQGTNAPGSDLDYSAFAIINDRNIFSPTRTRSVRRDENSDRPKTPQIDTLALVGTMSYAKGTFAFFDGSSGSYRKSAKIGEAVAGFTVTGITNTGASICLGTNIFHLNVGGRLRREDDGDWKVAESNTAFETASTKTGAESKSEGGDSAKGDGGESEILKRLLEKREKELKNEK